VCLDVKIYRLTFESPGYTVLDITSHIAEIVHQTGFYKGTAIIYTNEEGCAVIEIEYAPDLLEDLELFLKKLGCIEENLCDVILGRSVVIPVVNGSMFLGRFKNLAFIDISRKAGNKALVMVLEGIFKSS